MNATVLLYAFVIIVGVASLANAIFALIDYRKTKSFRLIYIPPEAKEIDRLSTFVMFLVIIVFILDLMNIVRTYTGFLALFAWVLFDDAISIYFRVQKWSKEGK